TAITFPYKILFVIDHSGSNRTSDPQDRRADAVQRVIERYADNASVHFGIIRFAAEPERLTPTFTRDTATLIASAIPPLRDETGGTDYVKVLEMARDFLDEDMRLLSASELARTRYDVQFLSDGDPNPCVPLTTVLAGTAALMNLADVFHPFSLRLSTTRLNYMQYQTECQYGDPTQFLQPMAGIGDGTFRDLVADTLDFDIGFVEILRRFESREFYIVNTSRVVWDDELHPDSDRDGIRDADDPNPTSADADVDGCNDRVDQALLPNRDLCHSQCDASDLIDRDGDAIPDCAEAALAFDATAADSDADGFPDDIELRLGTNALDVRTLTQDTDRDGVVDAQEIRVGTNPIFPDATQDWAYVYSALTPTDAPDQGTSCFDFRVNNVRLVETLATQDSAAGDNVVCLYVLQTAVDAPDGLPTVTRSCTTVSYRRTADGDAKFPADGLVAIDPEDFQLAYR
ncbi:MAG TPA: VWA domain-containing protein, partial [Myxococcota bacterium]|nr:VWA domain-containing protein [Myxococcota bacterium]